MRCPATVKQSGTNCNRNSKEHINEATFGCGNAAKVIVKSKAEGLAKPSHSVAQLFEAISEKKC